MLVIKDFDMPNNCMQCNFTYEDSCCKDHCIFTYNEVWDCGTERRKDCPLVCEIPEDAVGIIGVQKGDTNLDVLKAAFPDAIYTHVRKMSDVNYVEVKGMDAFDRGQTFYDEWCNAPYEKGKNSYTIRSNGNIATNE